MAKKWLFLAFIAVVLLVIFGGGPVASQKKDQTAVVASEPVIEPVRKCRYRESVSPVTDSTQEPKTPEENVPEQVIEPEPAKPDTAASVPVSPPTSIVPENLPDVDSGIPFVVPMKHWDSAVLLYRLGVGFNFPEGEKVAITFPVDVYVPPGVGFLVETVNYKGEVVNTLSIGATFHNDSNYAVRIILPLEEYYASSKSGWIRAGEAIAVVTGGGSKIRGQHDPRDADIAVHVLFAGNNYQKILDLLGVSDKELMTMDIKDRWELLWETDDPDHLRQRLEEFFVLFSDK